MMTVARQSYTATILANGKVLMVGGYNDSDSALAGAELYDPGTNRFALAVGTMSGARFLHTATMLANGKILVAGGSDESGAQATAELYDPVVGGSDGTKILSNSELYVY